MKPHISLSVPLVQRRSLRQNCLPKQSAWRHVTLLLRDEDDDFAEWDEPVPLPTSGTICVKVAVRLYR